MVSYDTLIIFQIRNGTLNLRRFKKKGGTLNLREGVVCSCILTLFGEIMNYKPH